MEIIPISTYIGKSQDVYLKRRKIAKRLKSNIAFLRRKVEKKKAKAKPSVKMYRISNGVGQVRLMFKGSPLEIASNKYAFRIEASEGQNIREATLEALKVVRARVLDGEFDRAIEKALITHRQTAPARTPAKGRGKGKKAARRSAPTHGNGLASEHSLALTA